MGLYAWAVAIALAALAGFVGGTRLKQGEWDAFELERNREVAAAERRRDVNARAQSAAHETTRAAIAAELRASHAALSIALRSPISCPAPGEPLLELGDVVLPAGSLDGVRRAAAAAGAGAAPSEPGGAVPGRPADPAR